MIILDVDTWYDFYGLDCQKRKKKKNLQVLWDIFLMLWTLWGLGRDSYNYWKESKDLNPTNYR